MMKSTLCRSGVGGGEGVGGGGGGGGDGAATLLVSSAPQGLRTVSCRYSVQYVVSPAHSVQCAHAGVLRQSSQQAAGELTLRVAGPILLSSLS